MKTNKKANSLYRKGLSSIGTGDFSKAIDDFSQAIKLDPNNPEFFHSRGISYKKLSEFSKAIDDFGELTELLV